MSWYFIAVVCKSHNVPLNRIVKIVSHPPKSWPVDKGPRIQGFEGSSEKALKTNK